MDGRECVVMHGEDEAGLEEFGGGDGVRGAHGEIVADGEHGDVDFVALAEQLHLESEGGVAGMVDGFALELDEEAGGYAEIDKSAGVALGGRVAGGVEGDGELDATEGEIESAAKAHGMGFFDALAREPIRDLIGADHGSVVLFGDGDGVADVVEMAMGDEDEIAPDVIGFYLGEWVVSEEGVDEEGVGGALEEEAGVAEVGNFHIA